MNNQILVVLEGMDAIKKAFDHCLQELDEGLGSTELFKRYLALQEEMAKIIARVKVEE